MPPAVALLQRRTVGASSWARARSIPWTASGYEQVLALDLKPKYSSDSRLRFLYGGATADLTGSLRVRVRPRVTLRR